MLSSQFRGLARLNAIVAALLGLASFVLYARTLAPGVLGGDSGEMQFAAYLGGIAHPTGYPLYLVLGWLWSRLLPWGDAAWRMNLFSALWGGAAVGLTYLLVERLLAVGTPAVPAVARLLAAAVAALAFACSEVFWSQAVVAEIYTLHAVFVALLLFLLIRWMTSIGQSGSSPAESARGTRGLAVAALTYGLSLTHHLTMLLLAPAALLFIWLTRRTIRQRSSISASGPQTHGMLDLIGWPVVLACVLLPLLAYLYIPFRAPDTGYLSVPLGAGQTLQLYDHSLRGLVEFVTGRVFAGALLPPRDAWARLPLAVDLFGRQFGWAGIVLGLVGFARLAVGRRWRLLPLTAISFLALVVFNLFYGIGDIHVFFAAPALILACWMGVGLAALAEAAGRLRLGSRGPTMGLASSVTSTLLVAASLALPVTMLLRNFPEIDRSSDTVDRDRWQSILAEQPPTEAILVSNDRDEMMPLWYMQQVEGVRPDVTGLFPLIVREPGWESVGQVTERALDTGRPVMLVKPMEGLEAKFALRPVGTLVEVLGPSVGGPPERESGQELAGSVALSGYDLRSSLEPGSELEVALHWRPLQLLEADYTSFVHLLDAEGRKVAQSDHLPGGVYHPTSLWQPGEVLLDVHRMSLPQALGPAPYALLTGFYLQPSMDPLGEPLRITLP
jgi:hypothetical protein